ncbi:hypothetical protein NDU88_004519, partial [Pleurodeles waltl]
MNILQTTRSCVIGSGASTSSRADEGGVREDLRMWAMFLESFNGIPLKVWRN